MKTFQRITFVLLAVIVLIWRIDSVLGQTEETKPEKTKIDVEEIGPIEPIREAEHRLGGHDRLFLIEDEWEFKRCSLLLPKLPAINSNTESLLMVMSWKSMPRSLRGVDSDGDTLVIKLDEAEPPKIRNGSYQPPEFLAFKLPAWKGQVRIEINGEPIITILRGAALTDRSNGIWEEILRLHSGGRPTLPQQVRRYKRMWRDKSDGEIKLHIMENKEKFLREDVAPYYNLLFSDLVDIRAKPILPRIFELIDTMGPHDRAFEPAFKSAVGIGGPEVLVQCEKAFKSRNDRSRHAAILILRDLGLPESRHLAYANLADPYQAIGRCSLDLLHRIGTTKDDVPHLIKALEEIERFYVTPKEQRPKVKFYSGDVASSIIYVLGNLGPDATDALPTLQRLATDPRLPLPGFRPDAEAAIKKIKGEAAK
jgi:hypothetical protein